MKLKNLSKEELESFGYDELSELILAEKGAKMKIVEIFKKISELLELSESEFENKIADFFELISTDKRFIVLDKGYCDLRKKHITNLVLDEEDDEIIEEEKADELEEVENEEEDIFYDNSSDEDDVEDVEEDLDDFILVDEEEETSL